MPLQSPARRAEGIITYRFTKKPKGGKMLSAAGAIYIIAFQQPLAQVSPNSQIKIHTFFLNIKNTWYGR
jgi:hypothetical protein